MARQRRARGYVEPRPGGTFRAVVYVGKDTFTGKPRYLREAAASEKEAEKLVTKLLNQVDEQRQPRSSITVRQTIDKWFEVAEHERSTRKRLIQLLRDYLDPKFGSTQLSKVTAEDLERFYAALRRCKKLCNGRSKDHECKGLSNSSIRSMHFMLRAATDVAVRYNYVHVNVAALAQPPSFKRPEPDPPSPEEVAAVLNDAWRDLAWGALLWLVMITGARRGEVCVLRWSDVDLTRGTVMIERAADENEDGEIEEKGTKSGQKRKIGLDPFTMEILQAHRQTASEQCESLGTELQPSSFVFSTAPDFSRPMRPDSVTSRYRRAAIRNNLRSRRLHSIRHYSATELLNSGVDLRIVSGRLGHGSGGATTLRFYSAWSEKVDKAAAGVLADLIPRPNPNLRTPQSPYEVLAAGLRTAISNGTYSSGDPLPTTTQLAETHKVSVGTVNRAIAMLKADGLVKASRGKRASVA
jgi:integrase